MRSVITTNDGKIQTVYNGEQDGDRWKQIPEGEYIHPRDRPAGYSQTRYLKSESDESFDDETESVGVVRRAIVEINAPDEIPNDGTEIEIVLSTTASDTVETTLNVDDMSETITIDGETTETLTTTASAGETITISLEDGVEPVSESIEVVST